MPKKKKPIKKRTISRTKKPIVKRAPIKAAKTPKRNIVRRTNKKGNAYFYNRRQGKIVSRDNWKKESKRIAKNKEALEKIVVKVKARPPRKGTKKYKAWRKRYSHLRKCSRVRSIVYELYPGIFPTYASTAAFCKFFLKRNESATLKNIDAAVKEFTQTIAKPDIPERFFEPWFWFESDFRAQELHDYVVENAIPNLWVRSQLSTMPTFFINEYMYDSTFKEYVDWKNTQQEGDRDQGRDYTELLISLHFNPKKTRWEVFVEEEDNSGGEAYTEKLPFDVLVKEEPKEPKGPIVARGGAEKVEKKSRKTKAKKVEKIEKKPLTQRQRNKITNEISTLEGIRQYIIEDNKLLTKEILKYKKAGRKDSYTEGISRLKIRRKEIDSINKKIIRLKTIEKRGYK